MVRHHPDDCLGCAINRIIRKLAKSYAHDRDHAAALRAFARAVAHDVLKEVKRRYDP